MRWFTIRWIGIPFRPRECQTESIFISLGSQTPTRLKLASVERHSGLKFFAQSLDLHRGFMRFGSSV